jgi:hypothetical protein
MSDNRTLLQKLRGIKETDVIKKSIPAIDDDWYEDYVSKSYDGKEKAITDPNKDILLGNFEINNNAKGFARKISRGIPRDAISVLRAYSKNPIISAIVNTRVNQVTNYARPAETAQDGIGYRVRLYDNSKPTKVQQKTIDRCMRFIRFMGTDYDPTRDDFPAFLRKLTHDTLIYDQVPIERIWTTSKFTPDSKAILDHVILLDPTTFVFLTDKNNKRKRVGNIYGQAIGDTILRKFDTKELAVFIRNKSTDLISYGYGNSELEASLREVFAQENAEQFNDRFFTNGGTVRGILNIKVSGQTSRLALDSFKRTWKTALTGIAGSWSIPMLTADDVKFVNLTPQAQDMQFEKWFNYLVNSICANYCIDPSEIGMTNRGGATGSKSNSLNEGNNKDKISLSKDKGLKPLLDLIANFITTEIIQRIAGSNYVFEFVGGDIEHRMQEASLDEQKIRSVMTVNEVRQAKGLAPVEAGDYILNGSYIQAIGQQQQQKIIKFQQQQQLLQQLDQYLQEEVAEPETPDLSGVSYQDMQAGLTGKPVSPSGKDNQTGIGKDGQAKNIENTNASGQGGRNYKKK